MTKADDNFCKILTAFIADLYKTYPDSSLLTFKTVVSGLVAVSPHTVVENFMGCVEDYRVKLESHDESFFLDGGLASSLDGEFNFLIDEINKVVKIWRDPKTTDKTKESIWKYFDILLRLGDVAMKN